MVVRITESYLLRNTIVEQVLGATADETPVFYRSLEEVHDVLGGYEDYLTDDSNQFFQQNKLMQWIQVTILRVPKMPCPSEYFSDRECLEPLYLEIFDEEEFDGVEF